MVQPLFVAAAVVTFIAGVVVQPLLVVAERDLLLVLRAVLFHVDLLEDDGEEQRRQEHLSQ